MSAMDVFPTLAEAAGIPTGNVFDLDGHSLWPAIASGKQMARRDMLYFASETPIRGTFNVTGFNDQWKLVQTIKQGLLSADVENWLFDIREDPYERNNLATAHPKIVADMAKQIHQWRTMYPVSGTRNSLVPPPGWRAPKDWTSYPIPMKDLQATAAPGMPPPDTLRILDFMHGEAGRLIYDCEPVQILGGGLCK
jgi:arylsulfatase A-like enzyme